MKGKSKPRNKAFDQMKGGLIVVVIGLIGIMFIQNGAVDRPAAAPSVTVTSLPITIQPTLEIRAADVTQQPDIFVIEPVTYYAETEVRVRECPQTDCATMGTVQKGTALVADALMNGTEVQAGNLVWYRVAYGGKTGWVYSGVMQLTNPAARALPQQQQNTSSSNSFTCPSNCDEARARGISASQAANCGLDRDGDGVACYGD